MASLSKLMLVWDNITVFMKCFVIFNVSLSRSSIFGYGEGLIDILMLLRLGCLKVGGYIHVLVYVYGL